MRSLLLRVEGHTLPGLRFCEHTAVHVGAQCRAEAVQLVPGDAPGALLEYTVTVRPAPDGGHDFSGPYVHGRRGDRFLYVTWGNVGEDGAFTMFRRAKLKLSDLPAAALAGALRDGLPLTTRVTLTAPDGSPRCATVAPPDVEWRTGSRLRGPSGAGPRPDAGGTVPAGGRDPSGPPLSPGRRVPGGGRGGACHDRET